MNMKKLWALLLALAMVFSLAACAGGDKDDDKDDGEKTEQTDKKDTAKEDDTDKEKEEEKKDDTKKASDDYEAPLRALEKMASDPTLETIMYAMGGDFIGKELNDFMEFYALLIGSDTDDLVATMTNGSDLSAAAGLSLSVADKQALTDDEIAEAQKSLDDLRDKFAAMDPDTIEASLAELTDEDWQEGADEYGMSVDEFKAVMEDGIASMVSLNKKLSNAKITDGYLLTCETQDGESKDLRVYCVDGNWVSEFIFKISL